MDTERICPNCRKPLPADVPLGLCPECLIKSGFPTQTDPSGPSGARFVPPTVEEITRIFPQLEILGFIGQGGMGAVYKARQPALDRFVALKILPSAVADDPGFAERFNREARALARLNHPNIVAVHDFGQAGGLNYLVMEFVDGANLRQVEQAGKLPAEQALAIVPQICEALQFAHNEGIVHRDIKPENLLLDKRGRLKITDFGIAKILGVPAGKTSLTGARDVVGTPHYMAPEQIEKPQTVDHRADIYSLGVVFYEMLTGELPLGKFAPPSKKVQVDVRFDEIVLHTLEKEPERRYQQASQVKTDVETLSAAGSGSGPAVGFAAQPTPAPPVASAPPQEATSDKIILPAFLLAFFFGVFGAHRFYVGKPGTAVLQLFTLGGLGIWCTIDWILILCKAFTDGQGRRITHWIHRDPGTAKPEVNPRVKQPPVSPPPPTPAAGKAAGVSQGMITAPAVGLMVAGILKLVYAFTLLLFFAGLDNDLLKSIFSELGMYPPHHWHALIGSGTALFTLIPALVIIFGAVEMIQVRSYAWSVAAAIVALVSCSLVGFPMGIWALIVLTRAGTREAFANPPRPSTSARWFWILAAALVAGFMLVFAVDFASRQSNKVQAVSGDAGNDTSQPVAAVQEDPVQTNSAGSQKVTVVPKDRMKNAVNSDSPTGRDLPAATPAGLSTNEPAVAPTTKPAGTNGLNAAVAARPVQQTIEVGDATHFSKSLVVAPGGKLMMNVDRGDVHIIGADQDAFEIQVEREVTRANDAGAARILKEEHLVLKQTGNEISLAAQNPLSLRGNSFWGWWDRPNLNVHYEITVPRKFDIQSQTSGGDVKVVGIQGGTNIRTLGGRLDCVDIDGDVEGRTMGGEVSAADCKGRLQLQTMGGGISIENFEGPSVQATTEGGSVSANFAVAPKADCELHTSGGNVTARIPGNAAVTVDAHTLGGSVRTDLPVQVEGRIHDTSLRGTINGGGPLLKLETMGGSVELLKR